MLRVVVVALAVVCATATAGLWLAAARVAQVRTDVLQAFPGALEDERMTVTTSWTSDGRNVVVTTRKGEHDATETTEQWKARHLADVASAQAAFPPDTDG